MWFHWVLVVACGIFVVVATLTFLVVACDLVRRPGIKPEPPTLGVQSFSQWTTREVP